jgi:rhamnose utilization protein RhaD (predicted bifunctional aldolase and dehydrogenase)/NAD(P)-dependent dehydrogenase (short-subunit alcohol dehydrogenase family)
VASIGAGTNRGSGMMEPTVWEPGTYGGDDLGLCVYASRRLGADPTLVLSGGGNSSVKTTETDVFGDPLEVLWVKGSGWDMGSIERAGFAPLRQDQVARLATLDRLSDSRMARELRAACVDSGAPAPSVESILHALLPYKFVFHSHADAVLALTNTPDGERWVGEVYGDQVVVVPYVMPGFVLAQLCAERFPAEVHDGTIGMVLLNHGLFTFADDARTAYETHLDLVGRAARFVDAAYTHAGTGGRGAPPTEHPSSTDAGSSGEQDMPPDVAAHGPPSITTAGNGGNAPRPLGHDPAAGVAGTGRVGDTGGVAGAGVARGVGAGGGAAHAGSLPGSTGTGAVVGAGTAGGGEGGPLTRAPGPRTVEDLVAVAEVRRELSRAAGHPMVLRWCDDEACARFAVRDDLDRVSQVGTATPDHVLRTKRVPLLGRDVAGYATRYRDYVERHRHRLGDREVVPVDPAPRLVIDPHLGVLAAGRRVGDAAATAEIYAHTVWVIERAEALGGYRSVPEADLFDVEYWELEQAKLARQSPPARFTGEVALVTGAASGIGRACAEALLREGGAVVGIDLDAAVAQQEDGTSTVFAGVHGDATDTAVIGEALATAVRRFGGLDMVVVNAGVFPEPAPLAELDDAVWDRALAVNTTGALRLLRAAHPYLRRAPAGGRVVVIGSKNAPAPGKGAGAYSASKAALTQLARLAALEWGVDGIRVNTLHPDAVFDTGLWTDELIAARAASYGLDSEAYRTRNVLAAEVASAHVAQAAVALCSDAFARTTGAQIPVDGGNDRVI